MVLLIQMDHRYKKFLVLVESGSYSGAAKNLRISQPAMTISIASLEKSIGKKLIARKKPKIELTEAGETVYQSAKNIFVEIEKMHSKLASYNSSLTHVGIIDSIAHLLYAAPKNNIILSDIEVMVDNSKRIINDISTSQIDFGFITGQPSALIPGLNINKLNDEPFIFVKKASMVNDDNVDMIDDWLAFNRASTSFRYFSKQFKLNKLNVKPIFYSTSMDFLKDMAIAGNGTALLPRHFVEEEIKQKMLKALNTPELYRPIWSISKSSNNNASSKKIADYLNELLANS